MQKNSQKTSKNPTVSQVASCYYHCGQDERNSNLDAKMALND
jgi:hypothetical protein